MAWVDEVRFHTAGVRAAQYIAIREQFVQEFWRWYEMHQAQVVVTKSFWFIRVELKVRDLLPVFERLFGPKPSYIA